MINLGATYPTKTDPSSASYPFGTPRNITSPGDGTGTPLEQAWYRDSEGFKTAAIGLADITPSNTADTAEDSQVLEALRKSMPYQDVRAFGAVGDGVADDTVAVQAAIDFAFNSNGVYFPPGNYVCGKLTVPSDTTLLGLGGELTLLTGANDALIETPVGTEFVFLRNLKLNGNSVNNAGTASGIGLINIGSSSGSPSNRIFIDNCTVLDARSNGIAIQDGAKEIKIIGCVVDDVDQEDGILLGQVGDTVTRILVQGCTVLNATGNGISAEGTITESQILGDYIDGASGVGGSPLIKARDDSNADLIIANNTLLNSVYRGIAVGGARIVIDGNQIENFVNDGIRLEALSGSAQSPDCVISNNSVIGAAAALQGITIDDAPNVCVTGNTVRTVQTNGIQLLNDGLINTADGFVVTGNNVSDFDNFGIFIDGTSGMFDGVIVGNRVSGVSGTSVSGIRIEDVQDTTITGNRVSDCATGLHEPAAGTGDFNLYTGNVIRGNTTPEIIGGANSVSANNL